jgi:hypothetical protein
MRTTTVKINGKEYLLCFSTRVIRACSERYGDMNGINTALSEGNQLKALDEALWLLATMIDAGARYAKINGIDNPPAPTLEDLYDICDISDFANLREIIQATITDGMKASVSIEAPKNAKTTPTT